MYKNQNTGMQNPKFSFCRFVAQGRRKITGILCKILFSRFSTVSPTPPYLEKACFTPITYFTVKGGGD